MPDRAWPCLSPAAYTPEYYEFLLGKLWDACESSDRGVMKTKRPPTGYARSLVAICDKIDVNQLRRAQDSIDDHYWRVVGSVFRQLSSEQRKAVDLDAEFLRNLASHWLAPSVGRSNFGLRHTVENLPQIDGDTLRASSVLVECSRILEDPNAGNLHGQAITLITSLGEQACSDPSIPSSLTKLQFSDSPRAITRLMDAIRSSLLGTGFCNKLLQSIATADRNSQRIGVQMFVLLCDLENPCWKQGVNELIDLGTFQTNFLRIYKEERTKSLTRVAGWLLKSEHRKVGIDAVEALAGSVETTWRIESVRENLDQLDSLVGPLLHSESLRFDDPLSLQKIAEASEFSVRLLLPRILVLATKYRPSEHLIDWITHWLADSGVSSEDKLATAETLGTLPPRLEAHLREAVAALGIRQILCEHLTLAAIINDEPRETIALIKMASVDWKEKLRAIDRLPSGCIRDEELIGLIVSRLNQSSRRRAELAINSIDKIDASALARVRSAITDFVLWQLWSNSGSSSEKRDVMGVLWERFKKTVEWRAKPFVRNLSHQTRREDVLGEYMQEAFLQFEKALVGYKPERGTMLKTRISTFYRTRMINISELKRMRSPDTETLTDTDHPADESQREERGRNELLEEDRIRLEQALEEIATANERDFERIEAFRRFAIQGQDNASIAKEMERSKSWVTKAHQRIEKLLTEMLERKQSG